MCLLTEYIGHSASSLAAGTLHARPRADPLHAWGRSGQARGHRGKTVPMSQRKRPRESTVNRPQQHSPLGKLGLENPGLLCQRPRAQQLRQPHPGTCPACWGEAAPPTQARVSQAAGAHLQGAQAASRWCPPQRPRTTPV